MKNKNTLIFPMLLGLSILILTGCQNADNTSNPINNEFNNGKDNITIENKTISHNLVIQNGCIGCGRCVAIAPKNFSMNGRLAEVISQDNISDQNVSNAVRRCPVSVIELIEV